MNFLTKQKSILSVLALSTALCTGAVSFAYADALMADEYLFEANKVVYDKEYGIAIAVGDVEIVSNEQRVTADTITVFEADQRMIAEGNVIITDKEGNQFFSDKILLRGTEGDNVDIDNLETILADGSRLTGDVGRRVDGRYIEVENAQYTPCEPCGYRKDGTEKYPWTLNAKKVQHDKVEKAYEYENAWMEFYGVPILWTPYFAHPDQTVVQKSGLVDPTYGYKSDLGWIAGGAYYYAIDPSQDATFGLRLTGDGYPVADAEFRKRFNEGFFSIKGSITQSDERKELNGNEFTVEDETRGHIEGKLAYHINDKWRTGFDVFKSTDRQYARLYDYNSKSVFENRGYLEYFDNRDYFGTEFLYFQDVRLGERRDQPAVLPNLSYSVYSDPGSALGGRLHADNSLIYLHRNDGQDITRVSSYGDWRREFISDYGLVSDVIVSAQGDVYYINERFDSENDPTVDASSFEGRFYPQIHMVSSYPLVKNFERSRLLIEPIVGLTLGGDIDSQDEIPNEDSNDLSFYWSNLFLNNRFVGKDRIEDGVRANYGLKSSLYFNQGSRASVYAGQSYRFNNEDIFPSNSGLNEEASDIVTGLQYYAPYMMLDYNAQYTNNGLKLRRHEVRLASQFRKFTGGVSYFYDKSVDGTNLDDVREQIKPAFTWTIGNNWRYGASALYDFSPEQEGLVKASTQLNYFNDCFDIGLGFQRNLVDEASGESDLEVYLTLAFKNLGGFESNGF